MNKYLKLLAVFLLISISGCRITESFNMQSDIEKSGTLKSLKKINDFPLYVMNYYGDYGFKKYLDNPSSSTMPQILKSGEAFFCTCFSSRGVNGNQLFGRNFDWYTHAKTALLVYTHAPGTYASMSMVFLWGLGYTDVSSLDPVQNEKTLLASPFWPVDGINERGVAVGCMSVDHCEAPWSPLKKTLSRVVIVRLILDYAGNVEEAIELLNKYNFDFHNDPLHYLICDASGNSVVVEFVNNEMKIIRNSENYLVSTNTILYGTKMPETANFQYTDPASQSLWRYAKVYENLRAQNLTLDAAGAMNILSQASANFGAPYNVYTLWSAVYNLKTRELDLVTNRKYSKIDHFRLDAFISEK